MVDTSAQTFDHQRNKENLQIGLILLYYNQHEKGMT